MSRKNHNSVLFLTTLGVYLGLVLVGATPQVLAQAATTKQFNVKDEIERQDDLENKPDLTARDLDKAIESYFDDLRDFVDDLKKLHGIEKFSLSFDTFDSTKVSFSPCPATGTLRSQDTTSHIDRWLIPAIEDANFAAVDAAWLGDCLPFSGFPDRTKAKSAGLSLSYDKKELKYELSVNLSSAERTRSLHDGLANAFTQFAFEEDDLDFTLLKVLYERTRLSNANNQVIIVTRLPRGSLDTLFASNAK